jgi:radical SAM superfamily enzyme YgiQ (UPF0313 family)
VVNVLLVSTYELGHQPLHLASPAARLRQLGHEVRCLDLAVESWDEALMNWAEGVAFSVPMHTAMVLAQRAAKRLREGHPDLPVAFYGLYAALGGDDATLIGGEYEAGLVTWAEGGIPARVELRPQHFEVPDRSLVPPPDRYARLAVGDEERLAGYVEASHGCRHRCRHCPIPVVYDGRYRITGAEIVIDDLAQQVESGATHITFGDPDFLNAPRYSLDLLRAAHGRFPHLTFDVTVKVSHILEQAAIWEEVAELGVVFVVSAFETTNDRILTILDKGHTAADMARAVQIMTAAGIDLRPSWLPFTPWTEPQDIKEIFGFLRDHDLLATTDPVQLSIRLLVPPGSLLADRPEVDGYDEASMSYSWSYASPEVGAQQRRLATIAESGVGRPSLDTVTAMWEAVMEEPMPSVAPRPHPRLTEPWFCCAEPTQLQLQAIGAGVSGQVSGVSSDP